MDSDQTCSSQKHLDGSKWPNKATEWDAITEVHVCAQLHSLPYFVYISDQHWDFTPSLEINLDVFIRFFSVVSHKKVPLCMTHFLRLSLPHL